MTKSFLHDLKSISQVRSDPVSRNIYSVDASIYELSPKAVVLPKTQEELAQVVEVAKNHRVAVTGRGAATGIAGGCIGTGLVIDMAKYLTRILAVEGHTVTLEPGVVQDKLNAHLQELGLRLGPDTSTGNRATVGGMLANNSAGAHSLRFGKMVDVVESVDLILQSGEKITFSWVNASQWEQKKTQNDGEGRIYRKLDRILKEYEVDIQEGYPAIPRRVSGYNLDALVGPFPKNVARLIAGSEGSLGIISQMTLKTATVPSWTGLVIIAVEDLYEGLEHVPAVLTHDPYAFEMIDHEIIKMGRMSPAMRGRLNWLEGDPGALFIVEFDKQEALQTFLTSSECQSMGYSQKAVLDSEDMGNVWKLRESGLGLLMARRSYSRGVAFVEDVSVAPEHLAAFMRDFRKLLEKKGKDAGIYGHVGPGCLHVRPFVDMRSQDDQRVMLELMHETGDLLLKHGGALSGEHGDGLVRSWTNEKMFGKRLYQAFTEVKAAFDPQNLMNPGKVVANQGFSENMRLAPSLQRRAFDTFLDFSNVGGFSLAVEMCNGNSACRKPGGTMCPSFHASNDEMHTTRARAQSLRGILNRKLPLDAMESRELYKVMELCIECKGCKSECPSQVDMAKMKSEFLYHYHKKNGTPLRNYLFANLGNLALPFANTLMDLPLSRWLLNKVGISSQRSLPKFSKQRFSQWVKSQRPRGNKKIVLFNDCYSEFNHPEIGVAAFEVLTALGYWVIVPPWTCCGRPALSKGMLRLAQRRAKKVYEMSQLGYPIVGLEPSCVSALSDDYASFGLCMEASYFEEIITTHDVPFTDQAESLVYHGHCHQKALKGEKTALDLLRRLPNTDLEALATGCCGMAGSFGYEKEHYDFSVKIASTKLLPELYRQKKSAKVIASGFSCRSQIEHLTPFRTEHIAETLRRRMGR